MTTMTHSANQSTAQQAPLEGQEDLREVKSRFGVLQYTSKAIFSFVRGLLGMPQFQDFILATPGVESLRGFHVLQSADDESVSMLCMSLEPFNLIDKKDIESACQDLGVNKENMGIFGIVSIRSNTQGDPDFTVNLRGPILFDFTTNQAYQHVFRNPNYDIRYPLTSLISR